PVSTAGGFFGVRLLGCVGVIVVRVIPLALRVVVAPARWATKRDQVTDFGAVIELWIPRHGVGPVLPVDPSVVRVCVLHTSSAQALGPRLLLRFLACNDSVPNFHRFGV